MTPQRAAIYRLLKKSKDHPSADAIFRNIKEAFPNISFDTVNRTLLTFSKIGILDVVEGKGSPRRFDPNPEAHHHFHCIQCGKIIDFYNKQYDGLAIPKEIQRQFTVLKKRVVLNGICSQCKGKK